MISPQGCTDLNALRRASLQCEILKVKPVSLSSFPPPLLSRHQEKNSSWWPIENIVFYLWASIAHFQCCPWKWIERQLTAWQKHTAVLLMPLVPLNMQDRDNGIHCAVGTDFLTHLQNGYTAPRCALCYAPPVNNESGIDSKRATDHIWTLLAPGRTSPCLS